MCELHGRIKWSMICLSLFATIQSFSEISSHEGKLEVEWLQPYSHGKLKCHTAVFQVARPETTGNLTNCHHFTSFLSISNLKDSGGWKSRVTSGHISRSKNIFDNSSVLYPAVKVSSHYFTDRGGELDYMEVKYNYTTDNCHPSLCPVHSVIY